MFVYETKDAYVTCHSTKVNTNQPAVVVTFLPKRPGKKHGHVRSVIRTKAAAQRYVSGLTLVS